MNILLLPRHKSVLLIFVLLLYSQMVAAQIANAPLNTASAWTNATYNSLTPDVTNSIASAIPLCLGSISNEANLTNASTTDFATISVTGLGCDGELSVKDGNDTYPAGTYAGYKVSGSGLLQASVGAKVTIKTFLGGSLRQSFVATNTGIGINTSLLDPDGNITLGFVTSLSFDEIRIEYEALVAVLFSAQVYHAVIKRFSAAPALDCNTQTELNNPTHPVYINTTHTGISGVACVSCSVTNADNAISASTSDFATLSLTAALGSNASISVKNALNSYAIGTFAGFNISNSNLINANLLSGITIRTYLNNTPQESSTSATLVSINSFLLTGSGKQLVGFITTKEFDEVQLEVTNLLGVVNTTQVYNAVVQRFCAGAALNCSTVTNLVTPSYPAVVDVSNSGLVCAGCAVNNASNAVDANTSNFASIVLAVGVGSSSSLSVKDVLTDYPIGTFAGADIENSSLIGVNLLNGATISTYKDGVFQESSGGNLISLTLLSSSRQIIGFVTTKSFDEIKITVSNFLGVDLGTTNIYNMVLKAATAAGVVAPSISATSATNSCPITTVNLNLLVTTPTPSGAARVWFTNNTHAGLAYSTPTTAGAGIYYAYFYDSVTGCYSPPSNAVTVTITSCAPDTDGDGYKDDVDLDDDNDGILDTVEDAATCSTVLYNGVANADCDGDGIPNSLDLDSDNDGINDVIEAGGVDVDGNGQADGAVNSSGIPASAAPSGTTPQNTDGQGGSDPYDLDSDNDGLTDFTEGGLRPELDADNNGVVDGNLDPDSDGILTPVDAIPNTWGDALLPDLNPTIEIDGLEFNSLTTNRDFIVNVNEINNKPQVVNTPITFRITKLSAFTISFSATSGTSTVGGGKANSNSDWTFNETADFIVVTAKAGITVPQNSFKAVGFTITRKAGIPTNTTQHLTVTIYHGSAGEEKINNNLTQTTLTIN
ncbi:hypothetical protein [Runella limosa]|uniref:hypothetical protein n=1 Tax=Runella limosa TaxID=370978 RepID=UPI0012FC2513|nr:hypothetical protein [Runella limosa]